jgi:hypothetical protein
VTGELSPKVRYFAQLGLVEAAHQLRRLKHRLTKSTILRSCAGWNRATPSFTRRGAGWDFYRAIALDTLDDRPNSLL